MNIVSARLRETPGWRLAALVAVHLIVSAVLIGYFSYLFNYGKRVVVLHVLIVIAVLSASTLTAAALLRRRPTAAIETLIAWAAAFWAVLLATLYGANFLSTASWGHNITIDLAARYVTRPWVLIRYVGAATTWTGVIAAGVVALALAVWLARSRTVVLALGSLIESSGQAASRALKRALAFAGVLSTAASAFIIWTCPPALRADLLAREPLVGFFEDESSFHRFALSRIANEVQREGPAVRAAYPKRQGAKARNVILIVPDSMRADHLGIYGYPRQTSPFLDRLFHDGQLRPVNMALATCPSSECGIASLLTSKTFGNWLPENFALHELLQDQGYRTNFILAGDHRMLGLPKVYGKDVSFVFDGLMSKQFEPTDDRLLFEALEEVPAFDGTPAFFYFHLMSSHVTGVRQTMARVFQPDQDLARVTNFSGVDLATHVNTYDNGIRQADAVIEQLWAALDRKGYLDGALVVVVADHGEGLGEHGARGHAVQGLLYQEFLRIPLLIRDDPDARYANLERATQVDVAPTIVDRLGLPIPSSWEGHSLAQTPPQSFSQHYLDLYEVPLYAVIHESGGRLYKYIRQLGREELFDLTTDPSEQNNRMTEDVSLATLLRGRLSTLLTSLE
jgi:glucan phosphoethanolaminetransferase (alkaline phosphatase superfamily)